MKAHKMPCGDPSCHQFVCANRNAHLPSFLQTANTEPMTPRKDVGSGLEEALAIASKNEADRNKMGWKAEGWERALGILAAEVRRHQAQAPAVEAVVTPEEEKLIGKITRLRGAAMAYLVAFDAVQNAGNTFLKDAAIIAAHHKIKELRAALNRSNP